MSEEEKKETWWGKTKAWADRNPVVAGAVVGFGAGSVVPGIGNLVGTIGGAVVGAIHSGVKEDK